MRKSPSLPRRIAVIRRFAQKHQRLPTARELISLLKFSSTRSATYHYNLLENAGYVEKNGQGYVATPQLTGLRYFESISAGFPTEVDGSPGEILNIESYLVRDPERTILVKVQGDSMKDAGVLDGDIVVVERQSEARTGDMVIALVDGEWTLKYLQRKGGAVFLRAANPKYPDIKPKESMSVEGVVRGVVRRVGRSLA